MNVSGKKAFVFGGTSGIGLATSKQLVALGADVVAVSRNPARAGDVPAGITLRKCDVLDRDALKKLFSEYAPFDILISAATGGTRAKGPFLDMEIESYKASFAKLWGYANVLQIGVPCMNLDGTIVLVSGTPPQRSSPWHNRYSNVTVNRPRA
jgi:NAD(P)-dependent dehydrogenase (short-subunit alcohol dehydrogenase family)